MRVLVTGASGLVGGAVVPELVRRGHTVRILSRDAVRHAERLAASGVEVERFEGDVRARDGVRGAAEGCEAVVHMVGRLHGGPAGEDYEAVNVGGTRRVVEEAARAGARRFVHLSALGADRGTNDYHRSMRRAEDLVRELARGWVILRPGIVYGPRDRWVTLLLRIVRTSPVVPLVEGGRQPWQLLWHEDLGQAVGAAVERADLEGETLALAGAEVTTPRDVVEILGAMIGKRARVLPLPGALATTSSRLAGSLGFTPLFDATHLAVLREGAVIDADERNALVDLIGRPPTPLGDSLRQVLHDLPIQRVEEGVGPLIHKRYRAPSRSPALGPEELIAVFRERCVDVMPIDFHAEPGAAVRLDPGATFTLRLPIRGHLLMRCVEASPCRVTIATVRGHAISGAVRFSADAADGEVGFVVDVYARAATLPDRLALALGGNAIENANWKEVARRGAALAGGEVVPAVEKGSEKLRGARARAVADAIARLAEGTERPATMSST